MPEAPTSKGLQCLTLSFPSLRIYNPESSPGVKHLKNKRSHVSQKSTGEGSGGQPSLPSSLVVRIPSYVAAHAHRQPLCVACSRSGRGLGTHWQEGQRAQSRVLDCAQDARQGEESNAPS